MVDNRYFPPFFFKLIVLLGKLFEIEGIDWEALVAND